MRARVITIVLAVGLAFSVLALIPRVGSYHLPGNQQGYEPTQPIAFSHRLHAGDLQISCQYCHSAAETGRHAGIPPASLCMNCHKTVTAPVEVLAAEEALAAREKRKPRPKVSPELRKLFDALGLDENLQAIKKPQPIAWVKVHKLPDFACFDHRAHVHAVSCQKCHGPVETMDRVHQMENLSMGWCVNCHREANRTGVHGKKVNASIDCAACHY
jgi:hypothetical protein